MSFKRYQTLAVTRRSSSLTFIYVDAPEHAARRWYIERFLLLRAIAFKESASDFHRYAALSDEAAEQVAGESWDAINGPNSERTSCRRASAPTSS